MRKKYFKRFEETQTWQESRDFIREIYRITKIPEVSRDFGICGQLQRAAVSISSNIAEGLERESIQELLQFLNYSKGSCGELRSLLYNAEDIGYMPAELAERLRKKSLAISGQLSRWMNTLRSINSVYSGGKSIPQKSGRIANTHEICAANTVDSLHFNRAAETHGEYFYAQTNRSDLP